MPQLLGWIAVGVLVWAGYRWLRKESKRVVTELREAEEEIRERKQKSAPKLEQDPETGVYKPVDE